MSKLVYGLGIAAGVAGLGYGAWKMLEKGKFEWVPAAIAAGGLASGAALIGVGRSSARKRVNAVIKKAGKTTEAEQVDEVLVLDEVIKGVPYALQKHKITENIESITHLGVNDDVIWPGAILRGDGISDFVYAPITTPRAPLTLSVSLEAAETGTSVVQVVDSPKLSSVREGISELLKKAIVPGTRVAASVDFSFKQVFSESQVDLVVGANVEAAVFDLASAFDWQSSETKTRIVVEYRQIYYSVDVDAPETAAGMFPSGIGLEELSRAMPPGSQPVYIAGVQYGLMAIMMIESDYSFDSMSFALNASYGGKLAKTDVLTDYSAEELMSSSRIKTVVYGGSTAGLSSIQEGYEGLLKILKASTQFSSDSPGVPIAYKFRNLVDNTLAMISMTSQYTQLIPQTGRYRITFERITMDDVDDEVGNEVEIDAITFKVRAWDQAPTANEVLGPPTFDLWSFLRPEEEEEGPALRQAITPKGGAEVFSIGPGAEIDLRKDESFPPGRLDVDNSVDLVFDIQNFNIDDALVRVHGYIHEVDPIDDDSSSDTMEIEGRRFGDRKFSMYTSKAGIGRVRFDWRIEPV